MQIKFLAVLLSGIFIAACGSGGGGGGGSNDLPPQNQAPIANAGADQTVDEGATVNLAGSGSDSDGTVTSYRWQQTAGTEVTISNADTANASFVAPMVSANEDLVFRLTVTDNDGAARSDTVTITVSDVAPQNQAPTADAGADQSVEEGATVILAGAGSDSDGTITSYSWQQTAGTDVTISSADTANASFVAPMVSANEDLVFRLTVTDNDGAPGSDTVTITVSDVAVQNQAPTANAGADQTVDEGATVNLAGSGSDSDGTVTSFSWQQTAGTGVAISNADTANASFVAPMVSANEDLVFRLTVTDNDGAAGSDTVTITVNDVPPPSNEAPEGIWQGTLTSNVLNQVEQIIGIITADGAARFVSHDGGQQFFGQIEVDGGAASGTLRAVTLVGAQFPDGSSSGSINVEGTLSERDSFVGTYIGVGDNGSFSVAFDDLYDRDSSLSLVAGSWSAPETIFKVGLPGFGDAPIGALIDSAGVVTGADLDGCDYDGSIGLLDSRNNIYELSLGVSSCGLWDGQYSGFGVLDDSSAAAETLTIAVSTNQVSLVGGITESVQESASGVWGGALQSEVLGEQEVNGLISEESDAQFISQTGSLIAGDAEVFGDIFRLSGVAYAPFGTTHPDGSVRGPIDARGTITTAFQSTGSFTGVGDSGEYDIFYDVIYERPSAISLIQGAWSTPSPTSASGDLVLTILANGEFSGTADGCVYAGTIRPINASFNMYRVEINVSSCAGLNGQYAGLGTLSDFQLVNDTLFISVSNDTSFLWVYFDRLPL